MTSQEFKEACLLTESNDFEAIKERLTNYKTMRLLHAALGLVTEAAEFADQLKKHIFYGKELDGINLLEELGDGNWYESIALDALEKDYEDVFKAIISKLKLRYGTAKFSVDRAINRDLELERTFLDNELTNAVYYPKHILEKMRALNDISDRQFEEMVRRIHTTKVDHTLENCPVMREEAQDCLEVAKDIFETVHGHDIPTKIGEE